MSLHVITVDLSDPDVSVQLATAGPDPDGDGPWQTRLLPVREIAGRERFDLAINASYFEITRGAPAATQPGQAGYVVNVWASNVGWTMMDGKLISPNPRANWPILWVEGDRAVRIGSPAKIPASAKQIITGNGLVMREGKRVEQFASNLPARHPRTVVGVDRQGKKLVMLTVDGRQPGVSVGMTGPELAIEMEKLGCWDAINLDGGGSSTLLLRDPDSRELQLLNHPSDGRERPISDALGIRIRRGDP